MSASRKNRRALVGAVIILGSIGWLAWTGIKNDGVYYQTVAEYAQDAAQNPHKGVRVTGLVVAGTIQTAPDQKTVRFTMRDEKQPARTLAVVYSGIIPDTFKAGRQVVVEGRRDSQGVFEADVLLAKCPSKYEAREGSTQ